MQLTIQPIWDDGEGMLELDVRIAGDGMATTQNVFAYIDDWLAFAQDLQVFANDTTHQATIELGSKLDNFAYFFKLSTHAHLENHKNRAVIEVEHLRNGATQTQVNNRFSVQILPAALNQLGKDIELWLDDTSEMFVFGAA